MARESYVETIAAIMADGTLKAIANVEVTVYLADSDTLATIYSTRGSVVPADNPFLTDASGRVEFWADSGDYDIGFHDTIVPPRIGDDEIGWQSSPPGTGGGGACSANDFVGDVKFSHRNIDHGRWLRMDGRELNQAEIEQTLGLDPGVAAALVSELGTGNASKYGTASAGRVKIPDTRRRIAMCAGPGVDGDATLSARALGSTGGVEQVTLTKEQSGLPAHGHAVTDPGHTHSASAGGGSSHSHTFSGTTSSGGTHTHGILQTGSGNNTAQHYGNAGWLSEAGTGHTGPAGASVTDTHQGHTHTYNGTTGSSSSSGGGVTINSSSTGITVAASTGADASQAHNNMPPFVTIGYAFILV